MSDQNFKTYVQNIQELLEANGWAQQLTLEPNETRGIVQIFLPADHPVSPNGLVNEYAPDYSPLEQVQQECLRALRTGHPGI